jgi:L-erythrulose 1-phosphate isomerase
MNRVRDEAKSFAKTLKTSPFANTTTARPFVIPPFPYIADVAGVLSGTRVKIGPRICIGTIMVHGLVKSQLRW